MLLIAIMQMPLNFLNTILLEDVISTIFGD